MPSNTSSIAAGEGNERGRVGRKEEWREERGEEEGEEERGQGVEG